MGKVDQRRHFKKEQVVYVLRCFVSFVYILFVCRQSALKAVDLIGLM